MTNYTFEDLVGDESTFFSEYFNQKPMLRKNSLPGDPGDLLSLKDLDDLLHLEAVRPPYIKVNLKGEGVPERGYTEDIVVQGATITDTVVPEKLYELFRAGATITWSSLNHIVPRLRNFTRLISDKMAVRTDSVAFLTPAGKKGFLPHHDPVDLFIVQLEGTKRWRLWNLQGTRLGGNAQYTDEDLGEPAIEVLMEPGDILYLPYNTPHAAAAEELTSLHLSIMMRPRMWSDLIKQTVEQVLKDAQFNEYPYIGDLRDPAVVTAFQHKLSTFGELLQTVDAGAELDRHSERGRTMVGSSSGNTFQVMAEIDRIGPDAHLRPTGARVEVGDTEAGRTQVTVNGRRIAVPSALAQTISTLDAGSSILAADLFPGASPVRSAKVAQGLSRLGLFEVEQTARS